MQIKDFERRINSTIMQRGLSYFEDGLVRHLEQINDTNWQAEVHGSDEYIVDIVIENGRITYTECDCPYDDLCKHIAATLLTIQQQLQQPKPSSQKKKPSLPSLLQKQSKEQLIELIFKIGKGHREFLRELELQLLPPENEIDVAANIIDHHLSEAQERGGFIPWGKTSKAIKGIELIQERVQQHINEGNITIALELAILCLQGSLEALECGDDSSGDLSGAAEYSIELIVDVIEFNKWNESEKMQALLDIEDMIFDVALAQWYEWQVDLLRACFPLCDNKACEQQFLSIMERLKAKHQSQWSEQAINDKLDKLLLELKNEKMTFAELEKYLNLHPQEHTIRDQLINDALHNEDFNKVLELIAQAPRPDSLLNRQWLDIAYSAHEKLGNTKEMQRIAYDLALEGRKPYYDRLKAMYSKEQWPEHRDVILKEIKSKHRIAYEELIVEEQQTELILQYCQQHPVIIRGHYQHLVGHYDEEVIALFTEAILKNAKIATSRHEYREIASFFHQMKLAGFSTEAQALMDEIKKLYYRRRALIDELNKI